MRILTILYYFRIGCYLLLLQKSIYHIKRNQKLEKNHKPIISKKIYQQQFLFVIILARNIRKKNTFLKNLFPT